MRITVLRVQRRACWPMRSRCRARRSTTWCRAPTRCTLVGAFVPLVCGPVLEARDHAGRDASRSCWASCTWLLFLATPAGEAFPAQLAGFLMAVVGMVVGSLGAAGGLEDRARPHHHVVGVRRLSAPSARGRAAPNEGPAAIIPAVLHRGSSPCRSTPTGARPAAMPRTCCRKCPTPLLDRLPGVRRRAVQQAAHRGRLPAQGLGLVRHRLQGRRMRARRPTPRRGRRRRQDRLARLTTKPLRPRPATPRPTRQVGRQRHAGQAG